MNLQEALRQFASENNTPRTHSESCWQWHRDVP